MEHVGTGPDRPDDAAENRKQIHQSTETRTRAETRRGHSEQHYPEDALSVCAFVRLCVCVRFGSYYPGRDQNHFSQTVVLGS